MKFVQNYFNRGFLAQKLVLRFSVFVLSSAMILMAFVAIQSVHSLSAQLRKILESESELLMQSMEYRLKTVVNGVVRFSEHRLVVNSLVDPEAAVNYLADIVKEFDKSNEVVSTAVVSLSGQPIYQSDSEFSVWFQPNLIHNETHQKEYDLVFLPPDSLIVFSSIKIYGTPQGFVVSKLNLSDQLRFVSKRDSRYTSRFEVFGYPILPSGGLELQVQREKSYFEQVFLADQFPILNNINTRLYMRVSRWDYFNPILTLLLQFFFLLIVFGFAAVWFAQKFGRQLADPILRLVEKVSRSSTSKDSCAPLGTFDELELLASAFDKSNIQMQKSQQELVVAKEKAEDAVKSRSEFFAVMSHELRTPMNGVLGMTDVLQLTPLSREQAECVETIRGCGEILLNIVNDVLDYTKIESGKLQLEPLPVDIFSLAERVLMLVRRSAENKGLKLRFEGDGPSNQKWLFDSVRLRQILLNLLSNAIKFTDSGEVVLKIKVIAQTQGADSFEISVCDTGIGIAETDIKKLFKSFTQADLRTTRLYGGTGLGLAICHKLVGLMDGDIHVESQLGQGSCFVVRLRFSRYLDGFHVFETMQGVPVGALNPEIVSQEFAQRYPLEIVVAEDDPVNRRVVTKLLEKLGYQSHGSVDGQAALEYVSQFEVDLIFMDLQMPRLNGLEATFKIREMCGSNRPYIIGMTAATLSSDEKTCLKEGMNEFLIKPIKMVRLMAALRDCYTALHKS